MAKYKLKATSVHIAGVVYKLSDNRKTVFDTEDPKWVKVAGEIEAAAKAGYLEAVDEPKTVKKEAEAPKSVKKEVDKKADK